MKDIILFLVIILLFGCGCPPSPNIQSGQPFHLNQFQSVKLIEEKLDHRTYKVKYMPCWDCVESYEIQVNSEGNIILTKKK